MLKQAPSIWSYQTGGNIYSSPTVANGEVYFGSCDHNVYAVGQKSSTTPSTSTCLPTVDYYLIFIVVLIVIIAVAVIALRKRR